MKKIVRVFTILAILGTSFSTVEVYAKKKVNEVEWNAIADFDLKKSKPGPKLKKIINKEIAIVGFMIPLDSLSKQIKNFLLVPYIPSCMHVPPPPSHQIILVKYSGKKGLKMHYGLLKVQGKLTLATTKDKKIKKDPMLNFFPAASFTIKTSSVSKEE